MEHAPNRRSLFGYVGIGFALGASIGAVLLVLGISDPYPLPDRAQDGDALIGYTVGIGFFGAVTGLLFGGIRKILNK